MACGGQSARRGKVSSAFQRVPCYDFFVRADERDPPLLNAEHAAFIQCGVSIGAATRGNSNEPKVARAFGCRVSADRRRVVLLFPVNQAGTFLEAVRLTGTIAVVFSQPSTHRTIQLKGVDASAATLEPEDAALCARYAEAFGDDLLRLGYRREFSNAILAFDPSDLAAIAFTPTSAYTQTPGPQAGTPLRTTA